MLYASFKFKSYGKIDLCKPMLYSAYLFYAQP